MVLVRSTPRERLIALAPIAAGTGMGALVRQAGWNETAMVVLEKARDAEAKTVADGEDEG